MSKIQTIFNGTGRELRDSEIASMNTFVGRYQDALTTPLHSYSRKENLTEDKTMNQIKGFSWDGIDEKYKWVAQDYNGHIYVYTNKPTFDLGTELWNNTNSEVDYFDCKFINLNTDEYIYNWQELCFPREETASTPKTSQQATMLYDPSDRTEKPYPSHAEQYRQYHGSVAWLYNPWTGVMRDARDIGSDVLGHLIGNV